MKEISIGVYNLCMNTYGGGERYLLQVINFFCRNLKSKKYKIKLFFIVPHGFSINKLKKRFNIEILCKDIRIIYTNLWHDILNEYIIKNQNFDIFINGTHWSFVRNFFKIGYYVMHFPFNESYIIYMLKYYKYLILKHPLLFIYQPLKIFKTIFINPKKFYKKSLNTYTKIIVNSRFTNEWLKTYYNLSGNVIYPYIEKSFFIKKKFLKYKRNIILSVGRFFKGGHDKNHQLLIETFIKFIEKYNDIKWELILVGGLNKNSKKDMKYINKLKKFVQNKPIRLITNIEFKELVNLYWEASIFWHFAGIRVNEKKEPQKVEHFGIVTAEAVASAAIPVIIKAGGQKEIVEHNRNGFLCKNESEVIEYTKKLIYDKNLLITMQNNCLSYRNKFSEKEFYNSLKKIYEV